MGNDPVEMSVGDRDETREAPTGGGLLRRHALVVGLLGAAIVAAIVLAVGTHSAGGGGDATGVDPAAATATSPLPSGHPQIDASAAPDAQPTPDRGKMIASLEKKHRADPGDAKLTLSLADAYLMAERPDKAMVLYRDVLESDPQDQRAAVQLAMAYHAKGDDQKALSMIEDVLAANPASQAARYNLAIIYFSQQQTEKARREWTKAAEIDPESRLGRSAQSFVDLMDGKSPAPGD